MLWEVQERGGGDRGMVGITGRAGDGEKDPPPTPY